MADRLYWAMRDHFYTPSVILSYFNTSTQTHICIVFSLSWAPNTFNPRYFANSSKDQSKRKDYTAIYKGFKRTSRGGSTTQQNEIFCIQYFVLLMITPFCKCKYATRLLCCSDFMFKTLKQVILSLALFQWGVKIFYQLGQITDSKLQTIASHKVVTYGYQASYKLVYHNTSLILICRAAFLSCAHLNIWKSINKHQPTPSQLNSGLTISPSLHRSDLPATTNNVFFCIGVTAPIESI